MGESSFKGGRPMGLKSTENLSDNLYYPLVQILSTRILGRILSRKATITKGAPLVIFSRIMCIDFKIFTNNLSDNIGMMILFRGRRKLLKIY